MVAQQDDGGQREHAQRGVAGDEQLDAPEGTAGFHEDRACRRRPGARIGAGLALRLQPRLQGRRLPTVACGPCDGRRTVRRVSMSTPTLETLRASRAQQEAVVRWLRPLGPVVLAVVVWAAFRAHPAPGLTGRPLAVSVALA